MQRVGSLCSKTSAAARIGRILDVCSNFQFSLHTRCPGVQALVRGILCMVAQVGDPGTVAVARREVDAVRGGQHLFQVALAVGHSLPQVEVDAALVCAASWASCSFTERRTSRGKARLFRRGLRADRRDGLDIDHAVVPQRLPQQVQHLAVIGQEAVCRAQRWSGCWCPAGYTAFWAGRLPAHPAPPPARARCS